MLERSRLVLLICFMVTAAMAGAAEQQGSDNKKTAIKSKARVKSKGKEKAKTGKKTSKKTVAENGKKQTGKIKQIIKIGTAKKKTPASAKKPADIAAGKKKAEMCVACHGINGISNNDLWPNLAGQKIGYIVKALQDFRSDARRDAQMSYWAKKLSDDDIRNLAAYYNSLK